LGKLDAASEIAQTLRAMRSAARKFVDTCNHARAISNGTDYIMVIGRVGCS
jgi:response regulator of citrate/malate metabolism